MKTNRKKSDTYRFNGDPSQHPHSIRPVTIADLEARIEKFTAKLSNPTDPDDKKWIQAWIQRYESELKKKRRSLAQKQKSHSERIRLPSETNVDAAQDHT